MTGPRQPRQRPLLLGLCCAALVAASSLVAPSIAVAVGATEAAGVAAAGRAPLVCADPAALRPALAVTGRTPRVDGLSDKQVRRLRGLTVAGRTAGLPARAQAVALTAWLGSHDGAVDRTRLGAGWGDLADTTFYSRLRAVDGWSVLSPSVAAHRVLGSPDPYVFDAYWSRALAVLAGLTGRTALQAASEVATGGALGAKCYADVIDPRAFPLPAGTGYRLVEAGSRQAREADPTAGSTALVDAACGTPVLAAISGIASVRRDVRAAGPWLVTVSQDGGPTTTYAHIGEPEVADGAPVVVGQQLATVGDYGTVSRCSLGFGLQRDGTTLSAKATLDWLDRAAQPDLSTPLVPTVTSETVFRMAQLNVLGAHLTAPGGQKASYASGPRRMRAALQMLDHAQASIVTLEEFETPAAEVVDADPDWQLFRATPNNRFRDGNTNGNAIAWRKDQWDYVDSVEFTTPWRVTLHMPVVRLRNKATGTEVVVVGVHNPATTHRQGDQSAARAQSRKIEVEQIKAIVDQTHLPVILGGDFNESSAATCDLLGAGFTIYSTGGDCGSDARGGIDLIFGYGGVDFTDFYVDRSPKGSITDHPVVYSDVSLPPPGS